MTESHRSTEFVVASLKLATNCLNDRFNGSGILGSRLINKLSIGFLCFRWVSFLGTLGSSLIFDGDGPVGMIGRSFSLG